jgi:hypothetical protein
MAIKNTRVIDYSTFGGGRNGKEDAWKIADNQAVEQQNISCTDGKFFPTKGDVITGNQISSSIKMTGLDTWDGRLVAVNGTKAYQKTEEGDTWYEFLSGLTTTKNTDFLEYYDDLYILNATDATVRAVKTELTADVTAGDGTINVSDTAKFSSTGTIYINGDSITYTGKTGTTFTGCSGALAHTSGDWVTQTSTPTDVPVGQFMEEYGNKSWVAGLNASVTLPTAPWRLYYSVTALATTSTNFYDFTSSGSGQEFLAHGDKITALLKFKNNLLIGKRDEIEYIVGFDDTTPPAPIKQQFFRQDGVINYKCLVASENSVFYFTGRRIKNLFTPEGYDGIQINPDFDDPVVDILEKLDDDQSNACMNYNPNTFKLTLSCKEKGFSYNNIKLEYDTKYDYWQLRTNQNASCYTVLNGTTYYGSDLLGEVRKDNTSYTVGGASYPTYRLSKSYVLDDKNKIKDFLFFHIGGRIATNTEIILRIFVDGELALTKAINKDNIDNPSNISNGSIGNAVIGNQTIGGGSEEAGLGNFFEIYPVGVRGKELQYSITSSGAGQNYEINSIGIEPQAKKPQHRELTG